MVARRRERTCILLLSVSFVCGGTLSDRLVCIDSVEIPERTKTRRLFCDNYFVETKV